MKITVGQLSVIADYFNKMADKNEIVDISISVHGLIFDTPFVKASLNPAPTPEPVKEWPWVSCVCSGNSDVPSGARGLNGIEVMNKNNGTTTKFDSKNMHEIAWVNVSAWRRTK